MAEVKVKVTAQNETRTGFQQALNDAKQFGNEATRSVTIDDEAALAPLRKIQQQLREISQGNLSGFDVGQVEAPTINTQGLELTASESRRASTAIRGLASDLANASSPAQVFEAVIARVAQMAGRLTSVVAGFAVGKIIAGQFDKLNAAFSQAIANAANFQRALAGAGRATDLSGALSQFNQLNGLADQTGQTLKNLQKDLGARFANFASGGVPFKELAALEESQRRAAGANLVENSQFLLDQSQGRLAVAGDSSAEEAFEREAKQAADLFALEQQLQAARSKGDKQLTLDLQNAIDLTKERFAVEDQIAQRRKEAAAAAKAAAVNERVAELKTANEERGMSPQELLARREEDLRMNLDRQGQFAAFPEQSEAAYGMTAEEAALEEEQITARILALREQIKNSAEAAAERAKQAAKSLENAIEDREFAGLSPDEQRAKIAADTAALIAGAESGAISPADAAQRALELQRREDALAGGAGGFAGAFGASALQRVGGASEEFFRVRPDENREQKRGNDILQKILTALEKGEPLVLKGSS
jgi:hypothetical protein